MKKMDTKKVRISGGTLVISLSKEFKLIDAKNGDHVLVAVTDDDRIIIEKAKNLERKKDV